MPHSMPLIQLAHQIADLAGDAAGVTVRAITADSRTAGPGTLFAALAGTKADGAAYVAEAVRRGAVAVLAGSGAELGDTGRAAVLRSANPRLALARMAARFYRLQPDVAVAVTGTNGKTSVAAFTRQIWTTMGHAAASLGTVGIVYPGGVRELAHTTPDPVTLHLALAELAAEHVSHVALEASSHGLAQYRLHGLRLAAGAFTNLTRDHLDYHGSFEAYFAAKMMLFDEVLAEGAGAVIEADMEMAAEVVRRCEARRLVVHTVGRSGAALRLTTAEPHGFGQRLKVVGRAGDYAVYLPLVGGFQASNALVAAGLAIAAGGSEPHAMRALEQLQGATGRLELVATTRSGAAVFVDYAHTPDALGQALQALRPYAQGRLAVVFGAGGDRDQGKRPLMGQAAVAAADLVYVTDDNPRSEDPARIRAAILAAAPGAVEVGDRAAAIQRAVDGLAEGDVLLVAGKGHERGQVVGGTVIPFYDHDVVRAAVGGKVANG